MALGRIVHIVAAPEFAHLILLPDLRLLGARHDHVVVCSPGPDADAVEAAGFQVERVNISRKIAFLRDVLAVRHLYLVLRRLQADAVHTYTPKAGLLGQIAAALVGTRCRIHSCRGLLYESKMRWWLRVICTVTDRITFALADLCLFVSSADRDFAVRERLCASRKARWTGNGVDLSRFRPLPDADRLRRDLRAELGIPDAARVFLTVGRFVIAKGYEELLSAAGRVVEENPDVYFVLVAPVLAGETGVVNLSRWHSGVLGGRILLVGRRDDIERFYCAADVLVHPSHREGVPRVLMEAGAMGLPLIAADIPGNRQVVRGAHVGRLFKVRDSAALESAIRDALRSWSATLERGVEASGLIRQSHDSACVVDRVAGEYERLLSRGRE